MSTVSQMAMELRRMLDDAEMMSVEEAKQWIEDNDLEGEELSPSSRNLVLGFGAHKSRRWWHREGENLVAGWPETAHKEKEEEDEEPAASGADKRQNSQGQTERDLREITGATPPNENFEAALKILGLDSTKARRVAMYVTAAYDIYDPASVWRGLQDCREILPLEKKRVMNYWVAIAGLRPDDGLLMEYAMTAEERRHAAEAAKVSGKKYIAFEGDVFEADDGDPDGVTQSKAYQTALMQRRLYGGDGAPPEQGMVVTLLKESAETERRRMELDAERRANGEHQPLYRLVNGQVIPTSDNDPQGMSLGAIYQLSEASQGKREPSEAPSLVATLLKEQAETERRRMEIDAERQQGRSDPMTIVLEAQHREAAANATALTAQMQSIVQSQSAMFDSIQKQTAAQMEAMATRMEHQSELAMRDREMQDQRHQMTLEMMKSSHENTLNLLTMQMEKGSADPMESINRVMPGIWEKFVTSVMSPPQPGPVISLGEGNGSLPISEYLKLQEQSTKREMVNGLLQMAPSLLAVGAEAAKNVESFAGGGSSPSRPAARQPAPARQQQAPQPPQLPQNQKLCVSCSQELVVPAGYDTFTCPTCGTIQTLSGMIVPAPTRQELPITQPPQVPVSYEGSSFADGSDGYGEEFISPPENFLTNSVDDFSPEQQEAGMVPLPESEDIPVPTMDNIPQVPTGPGG